LLHGIQVEPGPLLCQLFFKKRHDIGRDARIGMEPQRQHGQAMRRAQPIRQSIELAPQPLVQHLFVAQGRQNARKLPHLGRKRARLPLADHKL
jgi:hypothetical protein